jgi:hypothetical protein
MPFPTSTAEIGVLPVGYTSMETRVSRETLSDLTGGRWGRGYLPTLSLQGCIGPPNERQASLNRVLP